MSPALTLPVAGLTVTAEDELLFEVPLCKAAQPVNSAIPSESASVAAMRVMCFVSILSISDFPSRQPEFRAVTARCSLCEMGIGLTGPMSPERNLAPGAGSAGIWLRRAALSAIVRSASLR